MRAALALGASAPPVLVVEDDADIRADLAELLQEEGYEVVTASNGEEALEVLRHRRRPGLILLDLMMPVMNGWEFRAEQERDPALSAVPVVVLSGADNVPQKAADLHAAAFLGKPFDLERLLETVARHYRP